MSGIKLEPGRENCWKRYAEDKYKGQLLRTQVKNTEWCPSFAWEAFSDDGLSAQLSHQKLEAVRHLVQYGRANEDWLRRAA